MLPTGWPSLVLLLLVTCSYCCRRFAPQGGFFHAPFGAFVLAAVTACLSAAAQAIQAHGLHSDVIVPAVTGAILSLLSTSNPSTPIGQLPVLARRIDRIPGLIMPLLFLVSVGVLASCSASKALGACELKYLPQTEQDAIACAISVAQSVGSSDPASALSVCVAGLGSDQANCLMQAVATFFEKQAPAHGQALQVNTNALRNVRAWQIRHATTSSCIEMGAIHIGYQNFDISKGAQGTDLRLTGDAEDAEAVRRQSPDGGPVIGTTADLVYRGGGLYVKPSASKGTPATTRRGSK